MQATLSGILFVFMIVIAILCLKIGKVHRTESIRRLRITTVGIEWILLSEIFVLNATERHHAYLAFTSYYIAVAWYVFFMFRFCVTHSGYKGTTYYKLPIFWLTVVETVEFARAYFDEKLFTITHIKWMGRTVWASRTFSAFNIYTVICFALLVAAMGILLIATIKSPKIYRLRYSSVLIIILGSSLLYISARFKETPLLVPVIGFALCEIIVMYMAVYYAPKKLMQKALVFAAEQLNDGLVIYDENHHLQFVTENFCKLMNIEDTEELEAEQIFWGEFLEDATYDSIWNGQVKEIVRDGANYYYEVQHRSIEDDGVAVGFMYWIEDITQSVENYEKMLHRANYDELTDVYNEAHFTEECRRLLDEYPDKEFVMICSDVEKFKIFSDLFGKEIAQAYMLETAKALREGLAKFKLCRYGRIGENSFYTMIHKEEFDEKELLACVDKVADKFNTNDYNLSVNLGIYEIKDTSLRMSAIINRASMACDAAKGDYHNRVVWFDENVQKQSMLEEKYNAELTGAIETGQIKIFLQPQVDSEGKLIGAEALARWIHPEDGIVPPVNFIPAFEESGRITELDLCIWKQACEKLRDWKARGRNDLHISVNISAKDLYALNIYEEYTNLINEYGIDSKNLKLEITESSVINDMKKHVALVDRLQNAGFEIEMDDFGSAYSSFNMLKDICVDVLKLDMKFLGNTENVARSQSILKSIISLSKELNMKTVAEGVETKDQFEFLRAAGCDVYQGYYFSKPMSVEEFEAKYF